MIFNRTAKDVEDAKKIREEKVASFLDLTEAETETLEKGFITINTINRIEAKQSELKNILNDMGYFNTSTQNKSWSLGEIFKQKDLKRIVENNIILRKAFFVFSDTPKDPIAKYRYDEINKIEKILFDLDKMIEEVVSYYKECGNYECGG